MKTTEEIKYLLDRKSTRNKAELKYYFTHEDENKENLILAYKSVVTRRMVTASLIFLGYNILKGILWRYGYFAYFFFHTRGMSFGVYCISMYLINYDYKTNLRVDGLLRYMAKNKNRKILDDYLVKESLREGLLEEKLK